jgi:hypothetical protein
MKGGDEEMIKEYKVSKHNSTVCSLPGRDFDWSKFDWEGKAIYDKLKHNWALIEEKPGIRRKAPLPYTDNCLIAPNCEYLHVPFNWPKSCTIYRVRPNESMYAGETYRGHLVKAVKAIKKADGWYWQVELE